jgi:hypothetical protein
MVRRKLALLAVLHYLLPVAFLGYGSTAAAGRKSRGTGRPGPERAVGGASQLSCGRVLLQEVDSRQCIRQTGAYSD